jgi:hypothetical protein
MTKVSSTNLFQYLGLKGEEMNPKELSNQNDGRKSLRREIKEIILGLGGSVLEVREMPPCSEGTKLEMLKT